MTTRDIAEALAAKGFEIDRRKLQLAEPIKKLGEFAVPLKLHRDVTTNVKVKVVAEGVEVRQCSQVSQVISQSVGSRQSAAGEICSGRFSFSRLHFRFRSMPEAVAERTLPHNLEAERSVLGAILLHNDAFNLAAEVIDSNDFFRDAHRRIFDKMVKLSERSDAIDLVTLKEELGRSGELDEVGGPAYIAALVDGVPRSTNVEHYARIIKEKATLRNLIFSANKILATAYDGEEEADVILDQAEHAIFAIADDKVRDGFVSLRELAQGSLETIEKLHARKELVTGVPTGFTDLDEMTSGLQPSDLVIIAARPSMGKTSLVLNMAQHVGTKTGHDGRRLQPRDVERAAVPAHADGRGADRRAPAARRVPRRARLGTPVPGHRHAERGQDLHRRYAVDRRARNARQVPPAGLRARPAPGDRRLHPADAGTRPVRESHARTGVDLALAEGAREGTERARSSCSRS